MVPTTLSARATRISLKNPLVVAATPTTRVVRAVVGDKLFVIMFEKRGDVCKLAVTHELSEAPKTARHVGKDGWTLVLSGLKTLLETGESMPRPEAA